MLKASVSMTKKLLVDKKFTLFAFLYNLGPLLPYQLSFLSTSTVFVNVLRLLMTKEVSQQPFGVMGTYEYWFVVGGKEKPFQIVFVQICGFKGFKH